MNKVNLDFYLKDTLTVSRELLGKYLVRTYKDEFIIARITETEAYIGDVDKACHAYNGKRTKRTEILYSKGGYSYVYLIYGMYNCMNIVTEPQEKAAAVLLRSVSIVKGLDIASRLRYGVDYSQLSKYQIKNISNGPGKLCQCMNITRELNGKSLCGSELFVCDNIKGIKNIDQEIKVSKRIGIDYAEEAKDFMWRFYL